MVSEAVAADPSDSLSCQTNSLVCLDACGDLMTTTMQFLIMLRVSETYILSGLYRSTY